MIREEYPRPQLVRDSWKNLNGTWKFRFDKENKGWKERWFSEKWENSLNIEVPFVYQSEKSGVEDYYESEHSIVWYQKLIQLDKQTKNKQVHLHFGAVDYYSYVYVNGHLAGEHEGGHTSFTIDITPYIEIDKSEQMITLRVYDSDTDETIPRGKQAWDKPEKVWYENTTGIWQTVWLEFLPDTHIDQVYYTPDIDNGLINIDLLINGSYENLNCEYEIYFKDQLLVNDAIRVMHPKMTRSIDVYQQHVFRTFFHEDGWLWTPQNPNLFDINIKLLQENSVIDEVQSYFGMRKVHTENGKVFLNNKPFYQKLVLDQGYWPEGLMTAPDDESLKKDILLAKKMGFNGCRKHQKVEDPRFLYWADKLGYIVWGECASFPFYDEQAATRLMHEWGEIIARDYNHPSIITWVPLNESWGVHNIHFDKQQQSYSLALYYYLHSLDPTRLVISNDGWETTKTDIYAIHNYDHGEQGDERAELYNYIMTDKEKFFSDYPGKWSVTAQGYQYDGSPILLTEFGGIAFDTSPEQQNWGYTQVDSAEDLIKDYSRLINVINNSDFINGYCYTQLYDVESEVNGLLNYNRTLKIPLEEIKNINDSVFQ